MAIRKADIQEKIYKIELTLKSLEEFKENCEEIFERDSLKKDALLYRLYLLSDRVISLAEMVCKFHELGYPLTYSEFFYRLGDAGVIDKEFAYEFASIAKFRNVLAHDYEDIDKERVCKILLEHLDDVQKFLKQIKSNIGV